MRKVRHDSTEWKQMHWDMPLCVPINKSRIWTRYSLMAVRPQVKKLTNLVDIPSTVMEHQASKIEKRSGSYPITSLWRRRPYAALEWDASLEKVVSIPDQVGLSWRDLSCLKPGFYSAGLADVINVPHELLELKDLKDILSIEVWNTCISESERECLTELLPKGVDKESTVYKLLSGDNFQFGSPLLSWGTSVCNGEAHPDSICVSERRFKNTQKTYYHEMRNYHEKMIKDLSSLKELWISCDGSERAFSTKLHSWKSKNAKIDGMEIVRHAQTKKLENEDKIFLHGDGKIALNACRFGVTSINNNLHFRQRKRRKIGSLQESLEKAAVVSIDGTKRHMPVACNSGSGELSAEIMCTLKVSYQQYARILNLKQAGEELRFDSLSSILGNPDKLGICYLSAFDENNTQRIREHWSKLVEGIAVASATFLDRKAHKIETVKTFAQQCLWGRSHLFPKKDACKLDANTRDNVSSKTIQWGPLQQVEMHGNTCSVSSRSTLTWPDDHAIENFVCRTNLKKECIQQQVSASDSSSTVSIIADAGAKSITDIILNRQSPSKEQALCQQTASVSPHSIRNNASPVFCQADASARSMISGLESEPFLEHKIDESLGTQRGQVNMVLPESEIIAEDDEVSAIKTTWSSPNLEEEELHSENSVMRNVKKNDGFAGRNGSTIWDSRLKSVGETPTIASIQCSMVRSEVEQSKDLHYQCNELDSDLLEVQPELGFSSGEQLMGCQQGNSFLMNSNFLPGFYNHDNSTEEQTPQDHEHPQGSNDIQCAGYQPMISITANEVSQQSESSLRQYQQNEISSQLFHLESKGFENQIKQQMLFSESTPESHSGFLGLYADMGTSRLVSPVQTPQPIVRQSSLIDNSQAISHMPALSNSERSDQIFGSSLDLQLLADDRTLEQQNHFGQTGFLHLQSQSNFPAKPEELFTCHNQQHLNQRLPLYHELHQNRPRQHSTQSFFSSSSSILTGWQDPQQISSGRATMIANSSSQFGPSTGHWNNRNNSLQSNWSQMQAAPSHFSRVKYEETKLPSSMSYWNQLLQNGVSAVDPALQRHGQYLGTSRAFNAAPFTCTGQDDWMSLQQLSSGQQYASTEKVLVSGGQSTPWLNLPLGFHITHQLSNNQQSSLQEQSLSKNNSHLGTSFDYC